jgi:endonuclease/exonuclease/phosphatase (EEP) superfamily protein YafD
MKTQSVLRALRTTLLVVCSATIAGAALLCVGRYLPVPSELVVAALSLTPFAVAAAVVAAIALVATRAKVPALVGVVLTLLALATQIGAFVPNGQDGATPAITVMTSNMKYGNADADVLISTARDSGVDVLAVQELTARGVTRLADAGIAELFPYQVLSPGNLGAGAGLYSRYPLSAAIEIPGFGFPPVQARVEVRGTSFTVMSFHSKAPLMNGSTTPWANDLALLESMLPAISGPAIIAGDFNATRDHVQFRDLLADGFSDAADDAGAGIFPTFPTDQVIGPIVSIDHVVVSSTLVGTGVESFTIPGTDHRAVVATVGIRAP